MDIDLKIDGAQGEGGGQILRTSLSLSIFLNKSFEIINIRFNRDRPGLQPQHIVSIEAAAKICHARIVVLIAILSG